MDWFMAWRALAASSVFSNSMYPNLLLIPSLAYVSTSTNRHLPFAQPTVVVDDPDFLNWAKRGELALQCIFGGFEVEITDVENAVWCGGWREVRWFA